MFLCSCFILPLYSVFIRQAKFCASNSNLSGKIFEVPECLSDHSILLWRVMTIEHTRYLNVLSDHFICSEVSVDNRTHKLQECLVRCNVSVMTIEHMRYPNVLWDHSICSDVSVLTVEHSDTLHVLLSQLTCFIVNCDNRTCKISECLVRQLHLQWNVSSDNGTHKGPECPIGLFNLL